MTTPGRPRTGTWIPEILCCAVLLMTAGCEETKKNEDQPVTAQEEAEGATSANEASATDESLPEAPAPATTVAEARAAAALAAETEGAASTNEVSVTDESQTEASAPATTVAEGREPDALAAETDPGDGPPPRKYIRSKVESLESSLAPLYAVPAVSAE